MGRLHSNPPSTTTRTGFGPVRRQGLNPVIAAIETKLPSCWVRQAVPPTWKDEMNADLDQLTKGYPTSCSQPIWRPNAPPRARLPTVCRIPLACTSDSCGGLTRVSGNEAAQGLPDLDDIPYQYTASI